MSKRKGRWIERNGIWTLVNDMQQYVAELVRKPFSGTKWTGYAILDGVAPDAGVTIEHRDLAKLKKAAERICGLPMG